MPAAEAQTEEEEPREESEPESEDRVRGLDELSYEELNQRLQFKLNDSWLVMTSENPPDFSTRGLVAMLDPSIIIGPDLSHVK